jgi:hypothetical protein
MDTTQIKIEAITLQSIKKIKQKFHDQVFVMFAKVVENSFIMVKKIQQTNVLLEKFDIQMDRLINKLKCNFKISFYSKFELDSRKAILNSFFNLAM